MSWETLPLGKFMDLWELSKDKGMDGTQRTVETLAVLHGTTSADVQRWGIVEFSQAASALAWMAEPLPKPKPWKGKAVTVNGNTYRITTAENMLAGQYIDFQTYAGDKNERSIEILGTLLVPLGKDGKPKTYGDYELAEVMEDVRDMPYGTATSLLAFFLTQSQKSIDSIGSSLKKEMKRMKKSLKRSGSGEANIKGNGGGWPA